jgi:Ca2+-binding EF-hand superfamily protein
LQTILDTGVFRNCNVLVAKLRDKRNQPLNEQEFTRLFNCDYTQRENFDLLFTLIDTSNSGRIGKEELRRANAKYCTGIIPYD